MGFYNLPPAWDPGFALPKNVQDEGLERRAFTTKWLPRGTYDDPSVGTGGYAVPTYVQDEGYGQGTFTTKWQPEGSYDGPTIPNWLNQRPKVVSSTPLPGGGQQVTVQALGDDPLPEPFESYGQKAAQALIARVAPLPPGQRQLALKKTLDAVDKSLWGRTQGFFQRYVAQKMSPADAFPLALARALSTGIAAEVILTGQRGTAPQAKSLLGLGCYGCGAVLGALALGDDAAAPALPPGCRAAPAGYTWIFGATINGTYLPGAWAKLNPGEVPQPSCSTPPAGAYTWATRPAVAGAPAPVIEVRSHAPTYDVALGPFGFDSSTLTRTWSSSDPSATNTNRTGSPDIMYINPDPNFQLPRQPDGSNIRPITPDVLAWVAARLTEAKNASGQPDKMVHYGDNNAAYGYPESDAAAWFGAMGISPTTPVRFARMRGLRLGLNIDPFFVTQDNVGNPLVLRIMLDRADFQQPWDAKTNGLALKVWLSKIPTGGSALDALTDPMTYINPIQGLKAIVGLGAAGLQAAKDGLDALSNLACGVVSTPVGQAGAGAAAVAVGVPPQVGVAGANIAAQSCGSAPPAPVAVAPQPSILPYILLAGGGILMVALLTMPRKKES